MKVKVYIVREVEINDPAVAELDAFWRNNEIPTSYSPELDALVYRAARAVEKATGIPFDDDEKLTTCEKFDILLYLFKREYGMCAMEELIEQYQPQQHLQKLIQQIV